METKNRTLLLCIKIGLDIVWYTCLLASAYMLFTSVKHVYTSAWHEVNIPVKLSSTMERYYPSISINGSDIAIHATSGSIMISNQNPLTEIPQILAVILDSLLTIAIIYNIRKVFSTIYRNEPFSNKNIHRLRMTSLYLALFFLLDVIYTVAYFFILKDYNYLVLKSYHRIEKFQIPWHFPKGYLEVAAIVYIMAEILNYGLVLKRENEEFV